MNPWLQFFLTAALAAVFCRLSWQRGYNAGQLDARLAHLSTSSDKMFQRLFDQIAAMATGFALGYKHANNEKVQNTEKNDILKNLN